MPHYISVVIGKYLYTDTSTNPSKSRMIKEILAFWRHHSLLSEAVDEFHEMLDSLNDMFKSTMDFIWNYEEGKTGREIHKRDRRINKTERRIRMRLVEQLSINPEGSANQCLVLMSIAKDAERIGDYCKNLLEVVEHYGKPFEDSRDVEELKDIEKEVLELLGMTTECLKAESVELAKSVHTKQRDLGRRCEAFILQFYSNQRSDVPAAVSYVLIARFFKRVIKHLGNIASSVSMPVHKLDYFDKKAL